MKHMIIDCLTNQVEIRDLTADEIKQQKIDAEKSAVYLDELKSAELEINAQKTAILERLGITEDEAKLLLS